MTDGLEEAVAAKTVLSHADAEKGIVWVRGHRIGELVERYGYEGTIALLWEGFAGDDLTRGGVLAQLGLARKLAFSRLDDWLPAAQRRPLIEGVRMALAALPEDSNAATIAATLPVAVAALLRVRQGNAPVAPQEALSTAADFLRMLRGAPAEKKLVEALDSYLTTVIDNGLGTSTFAARVIISTCASLVSAILGAYGAFTGVLHGGAPALALDMLDAISQADDIDAWLDRTLASGERLMGFGFGCFGCAIRARTSCARPCSDSIRNRRGFPLRSTSNAGRSRRWRVTNPDAGSKPTSRWMPRSCSTRSDCRARLSHRCLPSRAQQAGSRTPSSSRKPAACSARAQPMWARCARSEFSF